MTPTWTSISANICQGSPLLRSLLEGGHRYSPHSNHGKGRGGQLKHLTKTTSSKGKGLPNLWYCRPTDNKGGPCHAATVMGEVGACSS